MLAGIEKRLPCDNRTVSLELSSAVRAIVGCDRGECVRGGVCGCDRLQKRGSN